MGYVLCIAKVPSILPIRGKAKMARRFATDEDVRRLHLKGFYERCMCAAHSDGCPL